MFRGRGVFRGRQGRHGRTRRRGLVPVALLAALAGVLTSALVIWATGWEAGSVGLGPTRPAGAVSKVAPGAPKGWPAWGFTHTQVSVDTQQGPAQALHDLSREAMPQVTPIMGWGLDNPEPSQGEYNWASLDHRMSVIRQTKGTPVVTLCCSPDWMKGGAQGQTDWTHLEDAVEPRHFDDFANLAAKVAQRYPDVKYYAVWNEFKGFWNNGANRWDYEGYTKLYNKVYAALKKVNPNLKVGGPYIVLNSDAPGRATGPPSELHGVWGSMDQRGLDAVKYWSKHKAGADFLAVDASSFPQEKDPKVDEFQMLAKFSDTTKWLRGLDPKLPVWWAEWYVEPDGSGWSDEHRGAVLTAALMEFARSGASSAFYWSPQTSTSGSCAGCLWFGSSEGGGGTPNLVMLQNFARWFPPGTRLVDVRSSDPSVRVLAQAHEMVLVNTRSTPVSVQVGGHRFDFAPYEVKWAGR
ncbi:xylan 1,4-beta-xylosidase [Spirillospora sp. NPDC052269]